MIKPTTIEVVLCLTLTKGWTIRQLGIYNAFPNGALDEEVYMSQPPRFINFINPFYMFKLHSSLYGLKNTHKDWFSMLSPFFIAHGFASFKTGYLFSCLKYCR